MQNFELMAKNLLKHNFTESQAKAIAIEIEKYSNKVNFNKTIGIKLDRTTQYLENKIYKLKTELLRLILFIILIQSALNVVLLYFNSF